MTLRRCLFLSPAVLFAIVAGYFFWGLNPERDPSLVPSALIDKAVPQFELPPIDGFDRPGLATVDLTGGQVVLVNFFASWCIPCRAEHPLLMDLADAGTLPVVAINYRDKPADARRWLGQLGNPYERIGADEPGRTAIDWGVSGVPETFLIDRSGRIRFQHIGPMTRSDLEHKILPLAKDLAQ